MFLLTKKIIILSFFILLLSGCSLFSKNSLENRIVPKIDVGTGSTANQTMEGILKAQKITLTQPWAYLLEDEMGAMVAYLQSKKINLQLYIDTKVRVEGKIIQTYDGKEILEVEKIEALSAPPTQKTAEFYASQNLGINLTLPAGIGWLYEEKPDQLQILNGSGQMLILMTKIENTEDVSLQDFVEDDSSQIELTINGYEALRTVQGEQIQVYLKADKNIYHFSYTPADGTEIEKSQFYALLKTFALNEPPQKPKICGGAGNIQCAEGYRCEIDNATEQATGVCVKINGQGEFSDSTSTGAETTSSQQAGNEKFQVIDYVNSHFLTLVSKKKLVDPQLQGYEFSENQIVSVILKTAEKKYKIQYSYQVLDEFEVDLQEMAYFEEGEDRDWIKISGEDQQFNQAKEIVSATGETQATVAGNMRYYQNVPQKFSIQYPQNWYYASFNQVNGKILHIGFADQAVELGNEKINVDIVSGSIAAEQENLIGGIFTVKLPRDETSHFEISGDNSLSATIKAMAGSLVN